MCLIGLASLSVVTSPHWLEQRRPEETEGQIERRHSRRRRRRRR